MIVKRPGAMAGLNHGDVAAEFLRTDAPSDIAELGLEFFRRILAGRYVRAVTDTTQFDIGDVDDRLRHVRLLSRQFAEKEPLRRWSGCMTPIMILVLLFSSDKQRWLGETAETPVAPPEIGD